MDRSSTALRKPRDPRRYSGIKRALDEYLAIASLIGPLQDALDIGAIGIDDFTYDRIFREDYFEASAMHLHGILQVFSARQLEPLVEGRELVEHTSRDQNIIGGKPIERFPGFVDLPVKELSCLYPISHIFSEDRNHGARNYVGIELRACPQKLIEPFRRRRLVVVY
ncbi:hypothetical protein HNQ77_003160 [Silvibacterium bohemicum]|uniref:Uncharacterized protein n=1 Tax=Silvibacterium bohemicum TaxID=1577686 RepID=A0A841JUZ0_9BACT|nr:hypothetical protein [Silvibacterium bohemicum]